MKLLEEHKQIWFGSLIFALIHAHTHARTRAHTHARTHARTDARTHTHTHLDLPAHLFKLLGITIYYLQRKFNLRLSAVCHHKLLRAGSPW